MSRISTSVRLLVAGFVLLASVTFSHAAQQSVLVAPPAGTPAAEIPSVVQLPVVSLSIPCCPQPKICYKHHLLGSKKFKCSPKGEVVLQVKVPCDCCTVDIPVCLPCCCEGAPEVCCHPGILGREVVEYKWCCGFKVKIVFDRCGDVVVHYHGG